MASRDFAGDLKSLRSGKFSGLWPAQEHILKVYDEQYSQEPSVGIELPTGAGKTLIALLIARTWIESEKKVVILSANKTLARQMRDEAQRLRLQVAYMEGRGEDIPVQSKRAYQRARKIGIMNYWVYFNQNPVVDPADLVVMDDAHLAEHCLHSLYSVMITRKNHKDLFQQLIAELYERFPEYAVLADAANENTAPDTPAELLSFIDHATVIDRIKEIVDSSSCRESDEDLKFRWKRLRRHVHTANLYIGRDALWLRPYIYPLIDNGQYASAKQVLYMSATIGDPGDLSRRLGVRPIKKIPIPSKFSDRSSGRRLIVMNRTNDDSAIPSRMNNALLRAIRLKRKSVWLCSSEVKATERRDAVQEWLTANGLIGHPTWILSALGDEIDHFCQAPAGHLFVAGRFDGMDFSGDLCRIVVLSTVPRAINLQEEFLAAYLRDSGFMRRRLNQRIVQGLGRCTRNDDDFAVYFLADQRFATHFSRESNREGIPQHIIAEIDLGQDLAEAEDDALSSYVERFLNGDFTKYDADLTERVADVPSPHHPQHVATDTSTDEVNGWTALFQSENYRIAQERFKRCWDQAKEDNLLEIAALHGWHRAKACYLDGRLTNNRIAIDRALELLKEAVKRGGQSSWFNRMRTSIYREQAEELAKQGLSESEFPNAMIQSFDEYLERLGTSGSKFQRFTNAIDAKLNSKTHADYQDGLEQMGKLLGYRARRPKYNASTDCEWRGNFGDTRELFVFEVKIDHQPSNMITYSDVGQASGQYNRARAEFGTGYAVRALIVTHLTAVAPDARSSLGNVRMVSKDSILALWHRIRQCMSSYRENWSIDDVRARKKCAAEIRPKLPRTGWILRAVAQDDAWISKTKLLKEWSE